MSQSQPIIPPQGKQVTDTATAVQVLSNSGEEPTSATHSAREQAAILVLGMHRSGTSAMTRVISLLGADLPGDVMGPVPDNNEAGFWESLDVYRLNDEILAAGGSRWDDWRRFNPEWYRSPAAAGFKARAQEVLRGDFLHSPLFVLKDPRMCRLLPFWLDVIAELGASIRCVIPLRNPLEVAASLRKRDGLSMPKSLILWLRHVLEAEAGTRGLPRAFPTYDQLLTDWRGVVGTMSETLALSWPRRSATAETEIDDFLTTRFRHHSIEESELEQRPDIAEWVKSAHSALLELSSGENSESACDRLDQVRGEFDRACDAFAAVLRADEVDLDETKAERDELAHRRRELEANVAARGHELAVLNARMEQREAEHAAQDQLIGDLRGTLDERAAQLSRLECTLSRRHQELTAAVTQRNALAVRLSSVQGSAAWQLAYPMRWIEHRWPRVARGMTAAQQMGRAALAMRLRERTRLRRRARSILRAGLFDEGWYAENNTDIILRGDTPVLHWLTAGWRVGRDPHPLFDSSWYLEQYPDVAEANIDPVSHYLQSGAGEKRDPHPLFDTSWYLERYPDVAAAGVNPLMHYLQSGAREGRDPHPLFAGSWYLERYPDVAAAGINPLVHYLQSGAREGRNPHPLFNGSWYLEQYPDVDTAGINPLVHYLTKGAADGLAPLQLFDAAWYLERNPDVAAAGTNPLIHYVTRGTAEGRDPHPMFDSSWYLERYPDVAAAGIEPLAHYVSKGAAEGRDPHPLFAGSWYLKQNPDVAAAGIQPLSHYLQHGAAEGRDPHPLFSTSWYLERNPDVAEANEDPFVHYLRSGAAEGREPHPLFSSSWYLEQNPDIAAGTPNPLVHYVLYGGAEGRDPHPLFDSSWYLTENPTVAEAGTNPLVHYLQEGAAAGCDPNPLFSTSIYAKANIPGLPAAKALEHFAREGRLVSVGAYRNADVLIALQTKLRAQTEMRLVRDNRREPRRFAVLLQCGQGSVHEQWLTAEPRPWDLIVNHYDRTFADKIDCDVELVQTGADRRDQVHGRVPGPADLARSVRRL